MEVQEEPGEKKKKEEYLTCRTATSKLTKKKHLIHKIIVHVGHGGFVQTNKLKTILFQVW